MNEATLKTRLHQLAEQDAPPAAAELPALLEAMMQFIGSVDPELRDSLIYPTFATWIESGLLAEDVLRRLFLQAVDEEHLYCGLDEAEGDRVFTRTFSLLLLPLILAVHRETPFLPPEEIQQVKERVLAYLPLEQDRRGYVPEKGWAHAAAHCADVLDDLALCAELGPGDLRAILGLAAATVAEPRFVYTHDEQERMSIAAFAVLSRQVLSQNEVKEWLDGLAAAANQHQAMLDRFYCRLNLKQFVTSLYFRLNKPANRYRLTPEWRDFMQTSLLTTMALLSPY
ncbi:MAG: DUF2785 domain-containing protein [Candidatus Promineifilaceae bacterium]